MEFSVTEAWNLPFFTKPAFNTTAQLVRLIKGDRHLFKFVPDSFKILSATRSFMFTLIYHYEPDLYSALKNKAEERWRLKSFKKLEWATVKLRPEVLQEIDSIKEEDVKYLFMNFSHRDGN